MVSPMMDVRTFITLHLGGLSNTAVVAAFFARHANTARRSVTHCSQGKKCAGGGHKPHHTEAYRYRSISRHDELPAGSGGAQNAPVMGAGVEKTGDQWGGGQDGVISAPRRWDSNNMNSQGNQDQHRAHPISPHGQQQGE